MHDSQHFYVNKWLTFAACCFLQFAAALPYTFGLFSADFKDLFSWSQSELAGLGTALNFGAFAAIIPGYIYSSLSSYRHGPRYDLFCSGSGRPRWPYWMYAHRLYAPSVRFVLGAVAETHRQPGKFVPLNFSFNTNISSSHLMLKKASARVRAQSPCLQDYADDSSC